MAQGNSEVSAHMGSHGGRFFSRMFKDGWFSIGSTTNQMSLINVIKILKNSGKEMAKSNMIRVGAFYFKSRGCLKI